MQSIRFAIVVCVIFLFALGMAGLLTFFKYEKTFTQIVEARIAVIGDSLRTNIETALSLGLQFEEIERLPALISREQKADPLILSIDVFTPAGDIIFSTQRAHLKQRIPAQWDSQQNRFGDEMWRSQEGADPVLGVNILNDFNQKVGAVALRYAGSSIHLAVHSMGRDVIRFASLTLLASATVATLLALWIYRLTQGALRRQRAPTASDGELAAFRAHVAAALSGIDRFEQTLNEIGRGAGR